MKAVTFVGEGREVYVETSEALELASPSRAGGVIAAGGLPPPVRRLAEIGDAIGTVCREVFEKTEATVGKARPSELVLEFALKLAGEAGVPLVSKGTVEGTFKVTAKWSAAQGRNAEAPDV